MDKKLENDNCEAVKSYYTVYSVAVAAALWCGIAPDEVDENLELCDFPSKAIFRHPYIPCLEFRCRAIHDAMDQGILPYSRENGKVVEEHVALERRHVSRQNLKEWVALQFPSDKPAFLFDEIERNTHPAINAESFRALQADRDALNSKLDNARTEYRKLRSERDDLLAQNKIYLEGVKTLKEPGLRAETTYLNIIGAMVELFISLKTPAGKPYSTLTSQTSLIDQLLANFEGKQGISKRGLEEKFAAAKKSLNQ
jgi:hypothetical protein